MNRKAPVKRARAKHKRLSADDRRSEFVTKAPKDFDVATNATPEEIRGIFRRSRIIGRRFRIVHVLCGRDLVEVTTFRGPADVADASHQVEDEHGRLLRDNVWGDQAQDAARRDFTINALFYDPSREEVGTITAASPISRRRSVTRRGSAKPHALARFRKSFH